MTLNEIEGALRELRLSGIADTLSTRVLQAQSSQEPFLATRHSIIVASNRVMQDWGKYPGDATMATTILDRLMHRAAMLEFEGRSYRLKEAAAPIAVTADAS
jgi:hypothetical protein